MTKIRTLIKLYLFLFTFSILPENAFSETTATNLQGLHKRDLIKILGAPSRSSRAPSSTTMNSSETLYYGNSQVSLIDDRVNTVFDLGELKLILARNKNSLTHVNGNWEEWPNPWTPPRSLTMDIIREIKSDSK